MADMDINDGMLSQSDLDAMIAAASGGGSEDSDVDSLSAVSEMPKLSPVEDEDEELPESSSPTQSVSKSASQGGVLDFPKFNMPTPSLEAFPTSASSSGLNRVRDIPLDVTIELGRTKLLIRDIMELTPGSIIELDKLAGEPVDLYANGLLIARGEVIVIEDNFGVNVTEIITAAERKNSEKELHALAA